MIRSKVRQFLEERGITLMEAHRLTGIARSSLTRIYRNEVININIDTLDTICKTFGCVLTDLFEYIPDEQMNEQDRQHVLERQKGVEHYSGLRKKQRERKETL